MLILLHGFWIKYVFCCRRKKNISVTILTKILFFETHLILILKLMQLSTRNQISQILPFSNFTKRPQKTKNIISKTNLPGHGLRNTRFFNIVK